MSNSGFRLVDLSKAQGCKQGSRGGWHYETSTGHKIYVKGPEECAGAAAKFLSKQERESQKDQALPEERQRLAQQAVMSKEELLSQASEGANAVMEDNKSFVKNVMGAVTGAAVMGATGDLEGVAAVAASEDKPGVTSITAEDIKRTEGFSGTDEEAEALAMQFNIKQHAERQKLPTVLNDEKRGHLALAKTFLGSFSMAFGRAAKTLGEKVGSERLKAIGEREIQGSMLNKVSDGEKALGAGYMMTYGWSMLAKPIYYGTYIGMGAQAVGESVGLGGTPASVAGFAISTAIGMQIYKRAIKPMTKKLIDRVTGRNIDPVALDLVNGYVRMDEIRPEYRDQLAAEMMNKAVSSSVRKLYGFELDPLYKAKDGEDGEASDVPFEDHQQELYGQLLGEVLPEVFAEVLMEINEKGFSEEQKAMVQKIVKNRVSKMPDAEGETQQALIESTEQA